MTTSKRVAGLLLTLFAVSFTKVYAGNFSCAENDLTHALMCFPKTDVRVNGPVRATKFYTGGPKGINDTGYTARVHCESKVMELTDRKGVAFVRNVPSEKVGLDFVRFLCAHKPVKNDLNLSTK